MEDIPIKLSYSLTQGWVLQTDSALAYTSPSLDEICSHIRIFVQDELEHLSRKAKDCAELVKFQG